MKDALDQQENERIQLLASSDQLINSLKETNEALKKELNG